MSKTERTDGRQFIVSTPPGFIAWQPSGGPGERFHAVAERNIPFQAIAQVIGKMQDVPVRAIQASSAPEQFGWSAPFVCMDCPASSSFTQSRLGWRPEARGLLSDLADGGYL